MQSDFRRPGVGMIRDRRALLYRMIGGDQIVTMLFLYRAIGDNAADIPVGDDPHHLQGGASQATECRSAGAKRTYRREKTAHTSGTWCWLYVHVNYITPRKSGTVNVDTNKVAIPFLTAGITTMDKMNYFVGIRLGNPLTVTQRS